jgi:Mrp family chromosome partitioning ATPase
MVADLIGPSTIADGAQAAAVAGAPVLASIPTPTLGRPPPPGVMRAARKLELRLATEGSSPATVLIAGPADGDDAAPCVAGLGIALAQAGRDVLLIDLDPARVVEPRLAHAEPGEGSLHMHGRRDVPGQQERDGYDWLLIHAPSIIESGEAVRVAGAVDAVVLVVRPRRTTVDDMELAVRLLERAGSDADAIILMTRIGPRDRIVGAPQRPPVASAADESPPELELRRAR